MSQHSPKASPPIKTYTPRAPIVGQKLTCRRCGRVHAFPHPEDPPIRCECGWWYVNHGGRIEEEFKPRLGA
jgi:hypothetical protein